MRMVSRGQAAKVVEMIDQNWQTVPRTVSKKVMGGPVLMRNGNKHVLDGRRRGKLTHFS